MIWDSWTVTNVYALKCPKCPMIRLKSVIKKSKATPKKYGVASYTKMRGFWKLALLGAFVLSSVM